MSQLEYIGQLRKALDDYYQPTSQADQHLLEIKEAWQQIQNILGQEAIYNQASWLVPEEEIAADKPLAELEIRGREIQQVVKILPKKIQETKSQAENEKTAGGCLLVVGALLLCGALSASSSDAGLMLFFLIIGIAGLIIGGNIRSGSSTSIQSSISTAIEPANKAVRVSKSLHSRAYTEARQKLEKSKLIIPPDQATVTSWESKIWANWEPNQKQARPETLRVGKVHIANSSSPVLLVPFLGDRGLMFEASAKARAQAAQTIRGMLLRLLASLPPGRLRFTFVDPVGRGNNVAGFMQLKDYLPDLVSGQAWADMRHIEQSLSGLTEQMDTLIQQYLRNKYQSIDAYNEEAAVPEPYRLVVVYDFPQNFSETAARYLVSIAENGPRCGIYPIILHDPSKESPYGFKPDDLRRACNIIDQQDGRFGWQDGVFTHFGIELDAPPDEALFDRIVTAVGEQAKQGSKVQVNYNQILPSSDTWWKSDSRATIKAALGPAGARKNQYMVLGEDTAHHVLIAGRIGSGKSNMLHVLITSLGLSYSPHEVELYLIDFKEGVGFKTYATHELPHARVIAIESEREFGLSVLEGLETELERRGRLFRANGVDNIKDYRDRETNLGDKSLSRILLIVDEFQVFFEEDDYLREKSSAILDRLVRLGRAFGIHVLLGSQTLAGAYSLARTTMDQMAVRIALQSSEADSRVILAEDNPAARLLSRPGEAIYNVKNGLVEGNENFQVAWLPDEERTSYLREIRLLAKINGYIPSKAQIVFEGNAPAIIDKNLRLMRLLVADPRPEPGKRLEAWIGEPVAIKESTAAYFRRQSSSNLLIVGRDEELALGMMSSALISLTAQLPPERGQFYIIDFTSVDADYGELLSELKQLLPHSVNYGRRPKLAQFIGQVHEEVKQRLSEEDESALAGKSSWFLIIHGLHKARDLREVDDTRYGYQYDSNAAEPSLPQQFTNILHEGPEVGVHTLVWGDSLTSLNKVLDRQAIGEFDMRVAMQMSADDSSSLLDTPAASKLGQFRAFFYSEEDSKLEKFRPYGIPSADWYKLHLRKLPE